MSGAANNMASWLSHITNANGIKSIYGESLPSLSNCVIHEVTFHRDGPRAMLRIDLPDYPKTAPEKWKASECNTVQINLMAVAISVSELRGWNTDGKVNIEVGQADIEKTILAHSNDGLILKIQAKSLFITEITAYRNSLKKKSI
ncbi:Imm50 family immunity protein [Marinobacter sp. JSM 1782161]|uniref:Imm50 family immunity protein n=1 Tax=Marinobacter sp. JSM 1782161 TaxID=2685906 RepID=UPI0014035D6A|nr:Imm50 family immunity protein [Marinobacter sp. JSM 1782161]